ncbi:MAG: hypothetical protein J2P48_21335 [Alphaproteobacteria bacterium]|nr:hypothetical protein [Alphaproteobacteria bacterium]
MQRPPDQLLLEHGGEIREALVTIEGDERGSELLLRALQDRIVECGERSHVKWRIAPTDLTTRQKRRADSELIRSADWPQRDRRGDDFLGQWQIHLEAF